MFNKLKRYIEKEEKKKSNGIALLCANIFFIFMIIFFHFEANSQKRYLSLNEGDLVSIDLHLKEWEYYSDDEGIVIYVLENDNAYEISSIIDYDYDLYDEPDGSLLNIKYIKEENNENYTIIELVVNDREYVNLNDYYEDYESNIFSMQVGSVVILLCIIVMTFFGIIFLKAYQKEKKLFIFDENKKKVINFNNIEAKDKYYKIKELLEYKDSKYYAPIEKIEEMYVDKIFFEQVILEEVREDNIIVVYDSSNDLGKVYYRLNSNLYSFDIYRNEENIEQYVLFDFLIDLEDELEGYEIDKFKEALNYYNRRTNNSLLLLEDKSEEEIDE